MAGGQIHELKSTLSIARTRISVLKNKLRVKSQTTTKEIADLLIERRPDHARFRAEQLVRDDIFAEALDIIELHVDLIISRVTLLAGERIADKELKEAVVSLIYAEPRTNSIKELGIARQIFTNMFGPRFVSEAVEDKHKTVNPKLLQKLSRVALPQKLVEDYMKTIAATYSVEYESPIADVAPPTPIPDSLAEQATTSNLLDKKPNSGLDIKSAGSNADGGTSPTISPRNLDLPSIPPNDDLMKRFEALRKK